MNKFSSAYNYYSKPQDAPENIQDKAALSLAITTKMMDETSVSENRESLKGLGLSEEKLFYYDTSLSCWDDFHACKKDF
jgi:hypothetical protein